MLVSFWYLVDSHVDKDDLKFLKQLRGVNKRSNGYRIIFKHYKHVKLIWDNIIIKMNKVIRCELQHGFHDERSFYLGYGKNQGGATSTCWILSYATVVIHNCKKFKMCWMVWTK